MNKGIAQELRGVNWHRAHEKKVARRSYLRRIHLNTGEPHQKPEIAPEIKLTLWLRFIRWIKSFFPAPNITIKE